LAAALLVFGIMKSVFHSDKTLNVATQEHPALEEGLEEFEPTHPDVAVGGPAFPSEVDRKTGLEDETIKQINSNLQILRLPPLRQVTSTYGVRLDPFTKKLAFHAGIDFKADLGTKIEAAMDGVVKSAGKKSMYGNAVVIKHNNGYETLYGHLSKILVQPGQKIKQKDIIGLAGSTGRSTGPHLHFELIKNGKKIDPLSADLLTATKK
jgi:murein DD-endopeptidase MepM/ murein hydrolase activator NlpD